jgi:hypothetical protein
VAFAAVGWIRDSEASAPVMAWMGTPSVHSTRLLGLDDARYGDVLALLVDGQGLNVRFAEIGSHVFCSGPKNFVLGDTCKSWVARSLVASGVQPALPGHQAVQFLLRR